MKSLLNLVLTVILLTTSRLALAQESFSGLRHEISKARSTTRTTVADPAEDNYDVKYVKLNLNVTNTSTSLSGYAITKARVVAPGFSAYVFELDSVLTIDSVLFNGVLHTCTAVGSVRTVTLSSALPLDTLFTVQVFYHGTPVSGTLFSSLGINNVVSPSWGNNVTYTLSESYHAFEWWPCKQSLRDKIDSTDVWLTVADSLKAGSNGILAAITPVDSNHNRYEWKERSPIDYYLVSLSVANYMDYSYYMHFTGSTDSMLVQNYVYNHAATLTAFQSVIDSTGLMIDYFSTLYGRYPFWHEKYGHCMAPFSGGMEHQTMTTLGYFEGTLVAHELGHQWFGDNATCGTWADIFMNEGFASYTEYLFTDHFRGHAAANATIQGQQTNVKSMPGGSVYVDDTTSENRIFDSRLSYDKGACLLHMLRFVISNDSVFFSVYKTYQQQMRDSTGTINDFKTTTESITGVNVLGMNLDTFYNQWAYLQGFPVYTVTWNQSGSDVYVKLIQATSMPSSDPLFYTPVEIRLHSAAGDTTIRVFNNAATQVFHFTWSKTMLSMVFDPNYWLLYQMNSLTQDPALSVQDIESPIASVSPNPATSFWSVDHLPQDCTISLSDISGRKLWSADYSGNGPVRVPADKLAPGMYLVNITSAKGSSNLKVVKE